MLDYLMVGVSSGQKLIGNPSGAPNPMSFRPELTPFISDRGVKIQPSFSLSRCTFWDPESESIFFSTWSSQLEEGCLAMARAGEGNAPPSTSSTALMRVIDQPIVSGAADNEVRKPGPVAYSCG